MLFPLIDYKTWASRYGLPLKSLPCQNCGCNFELRIPFAVKGYRGLMAKEHACGKHFISSIAIPTGESLKNFRKVLYS